MTYFYLPDVINYYTATAFLDEIRSTAKSGDWVIINTSWGGDLGYGYEIAATVRELQLNTRLNFLCASVSNIIFFAGINREVSDVAKMFFHSVSEDVSELTELNLQNLEEKLAEIKLLNQQYAEIASKYITADEAVQSIIAGFILQLIEAPQWIDSSVIATKFNSSSFAIENKLKIAAFLIDKLFNSNNLGGTEKMQEEQTKVVVEQPVVVNNETTVEAKTEVSNVEASVEQAPVDETPDRSLAKEFREMFVLIRDYLKTLADENRELRSKLEAIENKLAEKHAVSVLKPLKVESNASLKDAFFKKV